MKYWAYMNQEILGPFEKEKLLELPGFEASSLICPQTAVGEKTEDWKEASTYPEIAPMFNSPAPPAPSASSGNSPHAEPATAQGQAALPNGTDTPQDRQYEPNHAAPQPGNLETAGETGNSGAFKSEEKAAPEIAEIAKSEADSFKSMTLSQIRKKTVSVSSHEPPPGKDNDSAQFPAAAPQEEVPQQPSNATPPPPALLPGTPSSAGITDVNAAHSIVNMESAQISFSAQETPPAETGEPPAPASLALKAPELEALSSKIQLLCEITITRQELNSQLEPLRQKLERLGEAPPSTDAMQFQQELLVKLGYLEEAVSEIKSSLAAKPPMAQIQTKTNGNAEVQSPKKTSTQVEILDSGRKSQDNVSFVKKIPKLLGTLALILGIALAVLFGLKQFLGFDAAKFLPFPVPFLTGSQDNAPDLSSSGQTPEGQPQVPGNAAQQTAAGGQQAAPAKAPTLPPEVVYFVRTYAVRPGGLTLENAIRQEAAKAGWDSEKLNWENCAQSGNEPEAGKFQVAPGAYAVAAVIPSKDGTARLSFFYEIDSKMTAVKPLDEIGKTAFDALKAASALKGRAKTGTLKNARPARRSAPRTKTPVKAQAKPQAPRAQTPPKQTPPSDEYEYVDEEDSEQ